MCEERLAIEERSLTRNDANLQHVPLLVSYPALSTRQAGAPLPLPTVIARY